MYSYVTKELPALLTANLAPKLDMGRLALTGHSMGGHGALTIALKAAAGTYASVSAFSPICHPCECPWGVKGAPSPALLRQARSHRIISHF